MSRIRLLVPALALAMAVAAVGGCGDDTGRQASPLEGPPSWWAARERTQADTVAIHLQAAEPCEVSLIVEGLDLGDRALPFRALAAGQSVRVWWRAEAAPVGATPSPEDAAAGRSEGWKGKFSYGYADSSSISNGDVFWGLPGEVRGVTADVLPPPEPEALPFDSEIELAAIAFAEVDGGEIQLRPSPQGHRLRRVPPGPMPDRSAVLRLKLRVRHR